MTLQEAVAFALEGNAITRKAWAGSGVTIQAEEVTDFKFNRVKPNGDKFPFEFGNLEQSADDWEIVDEGEDGNPDIEDPVTYSDTDAKAQAETPAIESTGGDLSPEEVNELETETNQEEE